MFARMTCRIPLLAGAALAVLTPAFALAQPAIAPATAARIDRILRATPLIDGHNDLPWELREKHASSVAGLASGTDRRVPPLMTDIARLRTGRVGGQFWSVWIPAALKGDEAIRTTVEQIDVVRRMIAAYPADLEFATTAADIRRIHRAGRVASLIGIEGGHQIGNSLAALRQFHALGARYMTITHFLTTDWADAATDAPRHAGLSAFGEGVVLEMNRIGMMVDLSHVSPDTMRDALRSGRAPVLFTHSGARALNDVPRNVPDDVLRLLPANGGVVMVNWYPGHVSTKLARWNAERAAQEARARSLFAGQPDRQKAAVDGWTAANPEPVVALGEVADHIEHVARVAGHDHVGIGADLDGIERTVAGLDGVEDYPALFAELIARGWSDANLAKLAGGNLLRVMRGAELTADAMRGVPPSLATISAAP